MSEQFEGLPNLNMWEVKVAEAVGMEEEELRGVLDVVHEAITPLIDQDPRLAQNVNSALTSVFAYSTTIAEQGKCQPLAHKALLGISKMTHEAALGKIVSEHLANAVGMKDGYIFSGALGLAVGSILPDEASRFAFSNKVVQGLESFFES